MIYGFKILPTHDSVDKEARLDALMAGGTEQDDDIQSIACCALKKLETAANDYASRIWSKIGADVIEDVLECSGIHSGEGFAEGDVSLAIGRAILRIMGIKT